MELRQLKTFLAVAGTLSFTRAADRQHLAQSSVSAQIKVLEEELGVKLFDRIGRRVILTEAGAKLHAYARRMLQMTDELLSELAEGEYSRGALTIRVPETLADVYMPELVRRFHEEKPGVKLDCINCDDQGLREELNTGRIDLAFLLTDQVSIPEVNVRVLRTEPLALVAGPRHPFAGRRRVVVEDLHGETVLLSHTD